jgi:ABC-type branched-subunit amino acid transport system ATPase component
LLDDAVTAGTQRPDQLLRAEGITSGYGGVPIIQNVTLSVGLGEIVAIIGPNGAGKSTLLKSLVGILRVTAGRVMLGTDDVTNRPPEQLARRGVGYVPQVQDIFEPLTVLENLEMGAYLLPTATIRTRVPEVLDVFPALKPMLKRRADKLSGGERKMLAIARVLMLDPQVLILDEPTANLAPQLAEKLLHEQVKGLGAMGKAVLLVEQRARAALEIAAWTCVLVSGSTRLEGQPGELLDRQDFEELFLGAATTLTPPPGSEANKP